MDTIVSAAVSGILLGSIYALFALGLTLIFGVLRVVNFAHGEFLMVGMYLTFFLHSYFNMDPYLSLIIVVPFSFIFGYTIYKLVINPIINSPSMSHVLVTIGLQFFLINAALMLFGSDYRTVRTASSAAIVSVGDIRMNLARLIVLGAVILVTIALFTFLKKTYLGKAIRAVAMEKQGAMLVGINIYFIYAFAFGLGIACVGVSSALMTPIYYVFPMVGQLFVIAAFVVVVLGGMGSFSGALIAGFFIGLVESFSGVFIAPALQQAVYFVIFILVLAFRPSGLFSLGRGSEEVGLK